jgi:hypothetical protein
MLWPIELKFVIAQLFEDMKMTKKFHATRNCQDSTCFIDIFSGQKLRKFAEEKWLNKISPILVEGVDIDLGMSWKIFSLNEAI